MRPPASRRYRVRIAGADITREVVFGGAPVDVTL